MMKKITNLERSQQQATKPPFRGPPQRLSQAWKTRAPNEQRVPNTLDPSNVISQEETPWCLPFGDSHWKHEFPRSSGEPDHMDVFDTINHIFVLSPQVCLNIIPKKLEKGKREATKRDMMEIINKMDGESREKLKKKELQVYTR
jgi:hypothetical protein